MLDSAIQAFVFDLRDDTKSKAKQNLTLVASLLSIHKHCSCGHEKDGTYFGIKPFGFSIAVFAKHGMER